MADVCLCEFPLPSTLVKDLECYLTQKGDGIHDPESMLLQATRKLAAEHDIVIEKDKEIENTDTKLQIPNQLFSSFFKSSSGGTPNRLFMVSR